MSWPPTPVPVSSPPTPAPVQSSSALAPKAITTAQATTPPSGSSAKEPAPRKKKGKKHGAPAAAPELFGPLLPHKKLLNQALMPHLCIRPQLAISFLLQATKVKHPIVKTMAKPPKATLSEAAEALLC